MFIVVSRAWPGRWLAGLLVALAVGSPPAGAADEDFVGILAVVLDEGAARRLELSAEVRGQIVELINRREQEAVDLALEIRSLAPAEQRARLAPFVAESEKLGLALLSEPQRKLLRQLAIARQGLRSLSEPEVAATLSLSAEQKTQVAELLAQHDHDVREGSDEQKRIAHAVYERRLAKLLTPEQKESWDQLAGYSGGAGEAQVDENAAPPPAPVTAETPPGETEGQPAPAAPVPPSERPTVNAPANPPVAQGEARPAANGKLRFNFRYAPWKEVLDWFAQQADLSLVLDAPPPGTFNYSDQREYTPGEAIDLINSVLLTKGYTLVRRDRMLLVINLQDGVPANLVSQVSVNELDRRGESELISCLFTLESLAPQEAEAELKKLLGPQGSLVVLPKSRQVLVTDTAGRLRTVRDVIAAAERPAQVRDEPLSTFELKHVSAESVLLVARQLLSIPEERLATPDGSLRLAVDPLGTRFLVTGKPEMVARFEQVLKLVDVADGSATVSEKVETPQLEVYSVTAADPTAVLQVMQTLLAGMPDVRLASDPKTGNLVALARPSQHATIRATLEQMQRDGRQFEVINLRRVDPQLAAIAINKLFGADEEGKGGNGPKVEAEPESRQLLVRGSSSQIADIRSLLEKMGETEFATSASEGERSNMRLVPLTGAAAQGVLEQAQALWSTAHANKIRVMTHADLQQGTKPSERFPGNTPMAPEREGRAGEAPAGEKSDLGFPFEFLPGGGTRFVIPAPGERKGASPPPAPKREAPLPPLEVPPASKSAAQGVSGRARIFFVSEQQTLPPAAAPGAETGAAAAPANETPSTTAPSPNGSGEALKLPSQPGAEIVVAPGPGGIVIASQDLDALDEFESLLLSLAERTSAAPQYTVFYLKYAKAEVAGALVQEMMGGGTSEGGGGGSLIGDFASAALGDAGGGLIGSLLGFGGAGGGAEASVASTGKVTIVAEPRLNALVVQANSKDLATLEMLLKVIDQEASPEDVQTVARPRLIPVLHTSADEVATVVRQVYSDRVSGAGGQQRQPSPEDLIRALRGGRGRQERPKGDEPQSLTISVDKRLNALIVSAPEPLFQEVQALVEQLDQSSGDSEETLRVVSLKGASPELVQRALVSIGGDKVRSATSKVTGTSGATASASSNGSSRPSESPTTQPQPATDAAREELRRRVEFFNALQREGMNRGDSSRGGFPRGGSGGGR